MPDMLDRDKRIAFDRREGVLLTDLASKYDLSRGRISVILKEQGVSLTSIRVQEQMEHARAFNG